MHALDDGVGAGDPLGAGDDRDGHEEQQAGDSVVQPVHPALRGRLQLLVLPEERHVLPDGAEQPHHRGHPEAGRSDSETRAEEQLQRQVATAAAQARYHTRRSGWRPEPV